MSTNGKASAAKPGTRFGTQLRGEVAEQYDKRAHGAGDLALHYSGKNSKDVSLLTLREFGHFLHAESDPAVIEVDYSPRKAITEMAGAPYARLIHAVVKLRDGSTAWRRLVQDDSTPHPLLADLEQAVGKGPLVGVTRVEVWTTERIEANPMRLRNALRGLCWIAGARDWPLGDYKSKALALIQKRRTAMFADLVELGDGPYQALYGAAAIQLAFNGAVRTDLNEAPLTGRTLFHKWEG